MNLQDSQAVEISLGAIWTTVGHFAWPASIIMIRRRCKLSSALSRLKGGVWGWSSLQGGTGNQGLRCSLMPRFPRLDQDWHCGYWSLAAGGCQDGNIHPLQMGTVQRTWDTCASCWHVFCQYGWVECLHRWRFQGSGCIEALHGLRAGDAASARVSQVHLSDWMSPRSNRTCIGPGLGLGPGQLHHC